MKFYVSAVLAIFISSFAIEAYAQAPDEKYYAKVIAKAQKNQKQSSLDKLTPEQLKLTHCGPEDRDLPNPIIRTKPKMPKKAIGKYSGRCEVEFDVSKEGLVENLQINFCSKKVFAKSVVDSVLDWVYAPQCKSGEPIRYNRKQVFIAFEATAPKSFQILPGAKDRPYKESMLYWLSASETEKKSIIADDVKMARQLETIVDTMQNKNGPKNSPINRSRRLPDDANEKLHACMEKSAQYFRTRPKEENALGYPIISTVMSRCKRKININTTP